MARKMALGISNEFKGKSQKAGQEDQGEIPDLRRDPLAVVRSPGLPGLLLLGSLEFGLPN